MDEEKINEVGELLDVDTSDIKESKTKILLKKLTFPIVQISFFLITSISGVLLGYWEKQIQNGYPYASSNRFYTLGIPTILFIHSGNAVFSTKTRKKFGLSNFNTIFIVITNLILSFLSFAIFYELLAEQGFFCISIMYSSYKKRKNRIRYSNILSLKKIT